MNKKKILLTAITFILFLLVFILAYFLFQKYVLKINYEKEILPFASRNEKNIFSVNKVIFFSNCDAKNKTSSASHFTIENLYQYTDIALYLSSKEVKTPENTLKKVSVHNIKFEPSPIQGEAKLYFKSLPQFAKSEIKEENIIQDSFDFTITSDDEANLEEPILYNNLANPITLSYVNQNIKTDYTITDTTKPITYDGSLLKRCNIDLEEISCKLSFDIDITNNLDHCFRSTIHLDIPIKTKEKTIEDGNITLKQDTNFIFYRYQ